jgi:hypothetical protein
MSFHSVQDMLNQSQSVNILDQLDPKTYVETIAQELADLMEEFPAATLRISRSNMKQFCEDLRRGMFERTVQENIANGFDEATARARTDPDAFELPRRLETYTAIYAVVEIKLNAPEARLLASDLAVGIAKRPQAPQGDPYADS